MESELSGVQAFQQFAICLGHGADAAGDTSGFRIVDDGVQNRLDVTLTDGEGVDALAVELGKQGNEPVHKCALLATPDKEVGEGIFATPLAAMA